MYEGWEISHNTGERVMSSLENVKNKIVETLVAHRGKHRLTLHEMGAACNTSFSHIHRILHRQCPVSVDKLVEVLEAMGYEIEVKIKRKKQEK